MACADFLKGGLLLLEFSARMCMAFAGDSVLSSSPRHIANFITTNIVVDLVFFFASHP